jgi:hypothetical protein
VAKITIDLDDGLVERLTAASRARNITIEELLRAEAQHVALSSDLEIENSSHRAILSALDRPEGFYATPREALYDRERDRAEAYVTARQALLELIDNTEGDMGEQAWSRRCVYEP